MNICAFCGSSSGYAPDFMQAAKDLGRLIGKSKSTLIYGGAKIGLMGILADEVLSNHGSVIGVIPEFLIKKEVAHQDLSRLIKVKSMHERKMKMTELADCFITLPGGWGTLDETAEVLTWRQLNLITKPLGILNINSFYNHLLHQMHEMTLQGFLSEESLKTVIVSNDPEELITALGVKSG